MSSGPSVEGWWLSPPPLLHGVSISVALIRSRAASASSTAAGLRIQQKPEQHFGLSGPYELLHVFTPSHILSACWNTPSPPFLLHAFLSFCKRPLPG